MKYQPEKQSKTPEASETDSSAQDTQLANRASPHPILALASNDSGLMYLGVDLGVPIFGGQTTDLSLRLYSKSELRKEGKFCTKKRLRSLLRINSAKRIDPTRVMNLKPRRRR